MTARPLATSTISWSLVSLPVKLYSTGRPTAKVSFNWINRDTKARLKQQYIDSGSGEPVPQEKMIKGYEFTKGQFVTFEPDELKALDQAASEMIEITEFVPASAIERQFVSKAYYLGPSRGGERAYHLLSQALADLSKVAVAKYAARGKQYLVVIRPIEGGLVLEQMFYADEVRTFDEVPAAEAEVDEAELAMAKQLIELASKDEFDPGQYSDEVKERIRVLIDKKIQGEQITMTPRDEPEAQVFDLMEKLKASLESEAPKGETSAKNVSAKYKKRKRKAASA